MAEYDKEDGRPGSMGPDLDALDEDLLSADLEADLDGEFGEDALDEGDPGDSGDPGLDDEFEVSDDDKDDDEGAPANPAPTSLDQNRPVSPTHARRPAGIEMMGRIVMHNELDFRDGIR